MKNLDKKYKLFQKSKNDFKLYHKKYSDDVEEIQKLHKMKNKDPFNNQLHLSSYSGLINDPNGLTQNNGKFHIFYQWSPFSPIHKLKHWGHFETKDFINYIHTGLAIEPNKQQEKNGAFSGSAFFIFKKLFVFWTGNVKKFKDSDENRNSFILMGVWDEKHKIVKNKQSLFKFNKKYYTSHFRDPKIFKRNDDYYLAITAQTIQKEGTIAIYKSKKIDGKYKHLGALTIKPAIKDKGFMWECPDIININGKDFLFFSIQGKSYYNKKNENRDIVIFLKGTLDLKNLIFKREGKEQIIDEGYDFYASQFFSNYKRNIMIAWAGTSGADSFATFKHMWAHNLTIPREIFYEQGKLKQLPIKEFNELKTKEMTLDKSINLNKRLSEFNLNNMKNYSFKLINENNEQIAFIIKGNEFKSDRSKMSYEQGENFGFKRIRQLKSNIKKIKIIIDNSLIEIYINDGCFVFTSKYFINGNLKIVFKEKPKGNAYNLKPLNIKWGLNEK